MLAKKIDHTLLKPDATLAQLHQLCTEARQYGFASVCVNSSNVPVCARLLKGSDVAVCAVVGFPLGAMSTPAKVFEAEQAINEGAQEIDMVLAIGRLKDRALDYVRGDIADVVKLAHSKRAIVKVIIETALLTDEEKRLACRLCVEAQADFVKTSTGFSGGGATVDDVRLMKTEVGERAKIKASGGIRDRQTAMAMIEAGADRIGTSSGVAIVSDRPND